jgi:drug/metabolite transporter (DMT)-like permease
LKKWLKRLRGAAGMGTTWAAGWALGGLLIGVASILLPGLPWDPFFEVFDAPLPAMAVPGFFAGMFFSTVLGIAGRRRRFSDLSLPAFAAWGAVGGLMLLAFPFVLVGVGLASTGGSSIHPLRALAVIAAPFILLSVASASITLILARRAEGRAAVDSDEGEQLIDGEMQHLAAGEGWVNSAAVKDVASPVGRRGQRDA